MFANISTVSRKSSINGRIVPFVRGYPARTLTSLHATRQNNVRPTTLKRLFSTQTYRSRIAVTQPRTLGTRVTYRLQHTSSPPSTASATIADPDRPDLFYHLFEPPHALSPSAPVYALSFLEEAPINVTSRTIIGWLPAVTAGEGEDSAGLNDFVPNAAFVEILQEAVKSGLTDGVDDIQKNGALQLQQGWMHIHDERNPPPLGRIGDSDDILGTVLVENGKIKAETYQPMPSYRLCTADGIVRLTEGLAQRLKETLEREARAERS